MISSIIKIIQEMLKPNHNKAENQIEKDLILKKDLRRNKKI